jgi:hypothetical protein
MEIATSYLFDTRSAIPLYFPKNKAKHVTGEKVRLLMHVQVARHL